MTKAKVTAWRRVREGDDWHWRHVLRARRNGWTLTLAPVLTLPAAQRWYVMAEHRDGNRVWNSAWPEVARIYRSEAEAKAVAEHYADEHP